MAEDLARVYDEKVGPFVEEALGAEKTAWGTCSHCNHRVRVEVPDWSARTRALELLMEQGLGRLPRELDDRVTTIIVERPLCGVDDERSLLAAVRSQSGRAVLIDAGWTPPADGCL